MAKGQITKDIITEKILEIFKGSFKYDKEIRIPYIENGEEIQIKCVLTCAKTNVDAGGENAIPGETQTILSEDKTQVTNKETIEITQEEKNNVSKMLAALGL